MPARRKCRSDTGKPAGSMIWAATSRHAQSRRIVPVFCGEHPRRRVFLFVATGCAAAVGGLATLWPFVSQMNPGASRIAAGAPIEVDLTPIAQGQDIKVFGGGKPIYIMNRTKKQIDE